MFLCLFIYLFIYLLFGSCEYQKSQAVQKLNKENVLAYLEVNHNKKKHDHIFAEKTSKQTKTAGVALNNGN